MQANQMNNVHVQYICAGNAGLAKWVTYDTL